MPRRVLIVDDEPLIRWSLSETFGDCGYQVPVAGDAAEAMRAVSLASPGFDAIVLDLRLPDSNDLALLTRLRYAAPAARIILVTAYNTPDVQQVALEIGACCVLNKPFEIHDLSALVAGSRPSVSQCSAATPGPDDRAGILDAPDGVPDHSRR